MRLAIFLLGLMAVPVLVMANVVINEIAWMGSMVEGVDSSKWQYYEWIELYNNENNEVNLTGWILNIEGKKDISLENTILANGYYFIERSGYHAFVGISADLATSFGTGLANSGATLVLKNNQGQEIDRINGSDNWKIGGGDIIGNNTTKETAQRVSSGWITATATPKVANTDVSEPPQEQLQSQSSGGSSQYVPPENLLQIKAYAGEDKTVIVGANAEFRGQAFGLEDEPLENARYLWTFGDGSSKEGQNITHVYHYPGEYIVVLDASSGQYSASDNLLIKAIPNQVFISEIKTGVDSWIELVNKSQEEIDISGMQIKNANQIFIFPRSTRIRPKAFLVIPSSISGLIFYPGKGILELLYPGGFKADTFSYEGFPQDGQSFIRDDARSLISQETPGKANPIPENRSLAMPEGGSLATREELLKTEASKKIDEPSPKDLKKADTENINIAATGKTVPKSNIKIYLFSVLGLILFASVVIVFIRRYRGV